MKVWMIRSPNVLRMEEADIPVIHDDEVLVKNSAVCICNGSDPGIVNGSTGYPIPLPFGHEAGGVIVRKGRDVAGFDLGDRLCWWFAAGMFSEYVKIHPGEISVFKAPKRLSDAELPVMELVIAASRALMPFSDCDNSGRTLLILGLGPSGLICTQYARLLGFRKIIGWDLYQNRRELALSLGADEVYNPQDGDFSSRLRGMEEADVSLDMMGDDLLEGEPVFPWLQEKTRYGGAIVAYGHPEHGRRYRNQLLQGRKPRLLTPEDERGVILQKFPFVLRAIERGDLRIRPLITRTAPFSEVEREYRKLVEAPSSQIKVVFTMKPSS